MKNIYLFLILLSIFLFSCSQTTSDESPINLTVNAKITGTIKFTDLDVLNTGVKPEWILGDHSKLEVKVSKNLTSNPYNLKLTLTADSTNPDSPVLTYISDFDRKIIEGDRYRLITTIILHGNAAFIPGQTGGKIEYNNKTNSNGIALGSELEITIAALGNSVVNDSSQYLVLSGFFSKDNNNGANLEIGNFSIIIEGNNIIDTGVF